MNGHRVWPASLLLRAETDDASALGRHSDPKSNAAEVLQQVRSFGRIFMSIPLAEY